VKCGQCGKVLQLVGGVLPSNGPPVLAYQSVPVGFRTGNGVDIKVHFCSTNCLWYAGIKYARSLNPGAATTKRTFKTLYPGAVE
jgi:hypothetical protein